MGAIRDAIKSFDGADEAKKELENQLDNMTALAKAKADYFELLLKEDLANAGVGSSKNIPVKFIIDFTRQTHAYASSSADAIASTITGAIGDFINGGQENVLKGVCSLMTKAVQALFASKEGGEDEAHFISVFAEGRALVRLDLKAWKRFTNVKSLSESAEQISAFVMCKSTINAEVLDYNTFIQLYQKNLYEKASGFTPEQISQQLDEIDSIYKKFLANQRSEPKARRAGINAPSSTELESALMAVQAAEKALKLSTGV